MHVESAHIMGKDFSVSSLTTAAVTNLGSITPASFFGTRPEAYAAIYTMWRIKKVVFRFTYIQNTSVAPNMVCIGILDDSSGAEGDAPTSFSGVLALRTSLTVQPNETVVREYKPANKNWLFTYQASGNDPRLTVAGELYVAQVSVANATLYIQADYSIAFKGATDIGATERLTAFRQTRIVESQGSSETSGFEIVPRGVSEPVTNSLRALPTQGTLRHV
jgi:hypothetical protein